MIIDAVAGVQPQSETVWRQADKYQVPRICFINKMDRVGADFQNAIDSLVQRLGANPVAIQVPIGAEDGFRGMVDLIEERAYFYDDDSPTPPTTGPVPQEMLEIVSDYRSRMIEKVAETDDDLLLKYLEGQEISVTDLKRALRSGTITGSIVPVLCGSALRNRGVHPLLDAITDFLPSPEDVPPTVATDYKSGDEIVITPGETDSFSALVFKSVADPFIGRLVYFRVYSGSLVAGGVAFNSTTGHRERIGRLVKMHADRREEVDEVHAGDIVAAVGMKDATTGDTVSDLKSPVVLDTITFPDPVISLSLIHI